DDGGVQVKVDGYTLAVLLTAIYQPELEFQLGRSLSAGAPVFHAPGRSLILRGDEIGGVAAGGVIALSGSGNLPGRDVFAHERVHILQRDFLGHLWGDPLEGGLLLRTRPGAVLSRYISPGLVSGSVYGLWELLGADDAENPVQVEANFLDGRR